MKGWKRVLAWSLSLILDGGSAAAHEIYTGLYSHKGQLCCGGNDCFLTEYREVKSHFEFETKEHKWILIPQDEITFLPVPGDDLTKGTPHRAHMCYRDVTDEDKMRSPGRIFSGDGQDIFLYCAFIPPGPT